MGVRCKMLKQGSLMIVGVKINPDSYKKIKGLIEKGKYESLESFVEIAILNQILLESSDGASFVSGKETVAPQREDTIHKSGSTKQAIAPQLSMQFLSCPHDAPIPVFPSMVLSQETKSFPLWGQINRYAPAKIVLRILANQVLSGVDHVDIKRFSADVTETATTLRNHIEKKDTKKRIRGTEFYIALPKKDPGSQQRFMNYYIGKIPSGKWTDGILTGLGLVRIEQAEDGPVTISMTEAGRVFGCLPSPIIDEFLIQGKQIEHPLSPVEVEFLLNHLKTYRPGEFEFTMATLRFVEDAANTPASLRQKVGVYLREKYPMSMISEKFVNTMLVGLIGRLVEMHLVEIEKNAQKSKYSITNAGNDLLNKEATI